MRRIQQGEHRAFEELVRLHQGTVVGTAYRMLGDMEDAHDVAQQVFIRIWKSAARYEPSAKFSTWMFTILRNLAFNEHRRRSRHRAESLDAAAEAYGLEIPDTGMKSADAVLNQKELEQAIDDAIQSLPENQRMAVSLRKFQDLSYEEIAEIMETSVSAVKSLLFRARGELKLRLQTYLE
jgi:RNA polymerase sigma-70 factor (ECF subfamily)